MRTARVTWLIRSPASSPYLRFPLNNLRRFACGNPPLPCYSGPEVTHMSATAVVPAQLKIDRAAINRAAVNRANAQHSTGPRTESGKQRSSLNALRHGPTAATAVLPAEDAAAYESHRRQFIGEYQPATPTETQLVQELVDTSWRLNRIPILEAELLARAGDMCAKPDPIVNSIADAMRALAALGMHGQRLSRQFQKALDQLREIQTERHDRERRQLKDAAALLELHKHKGLPWEPADDGFVFSKQQVETQAQRLMRQNEARHVGYVRFEMAPQLQKAY